MSDPRELRLPTAAWYGDRELSLLVPEAWEVETFWPDTPPPLTAADLGQALEHPVGQQPLRELARDKERPVIVVDDLTRPTPADKVLPHLLRQLEEGGHRREDVTVVMAGGTHRPATREQIVRKVGEAAAACRLVAHDCTKDLVRAGRTSFGTPVLLNRMVANADLLVGIGGVYPQHSVGFGGGSKLILGVLGKRSISALHYGHSSVSGTYDVDNDFRHDLDEVAELAGLRTVVTLHVDAWRRVVRAISGDHRVYYRDAVAFSREAYGADTPGDADVVLVNAYPMDTALTFTRSKGMAPLFQAAPGASRVLISACSEGLGYHGLFPFLNGPRYERQLHHLRRLRAIRPGHIPRKVVRRARRLVEANMRGAGGPPTGASHHLPPLAGGEPAGPRPTWFMPTECQPEALPERIPGLKVETRWPGIVNEVNREQGDRRRLRVAVYPCASLACLRFTGGEHTAYLTSAVAG